MEIKRTFGRTLLLAAIFGAASLTMADEPAGFISTDAAAGSAVEAVDAAIPQTAPAADAKAVAPELFQNEQAASAWNVIELGGFINGGGIFNTHGANYNMIAAGSDNDIQLNTAYLRAAKKAQTGYGVIDWGFGSDVLFGSEGRLFAGYTGFDSDWGTGHRSSNLNDNPLVPGAADLPDEARVNYGFAMPQLYGEFTVNNLRVKAGRMYGLMGYEGPGDSRFFYTYGRAFEVTPVTHSGVISTYTGIQNTELSIGWVSGENNTFSHLYKESLITGGVKVTNGDAAWLKYAFVVGDGAMGGTGGDLFRNDVVLGANLGNGWDTAFIFNYGKFDGDQPLGIWGGSGTLNDLAQFYGSLKYQTWGNFLYYRVNCHWKVGSRIEWQRGKAEGQAMEIFEFTYGANWTPTGYDNFVIRPEIRYDKARIPEDRVEGMFGNVLSHDDQITLAVDMLYKF